MQGLALRALMGLPPAPSADERELLARVAISARVLYAGIYRIEPGSRVKALVGVAGEQGAASIGTIMRVLDPSGEQRALALYGSLALHVLLGEVALRAGQAGPFDQLAQAARVGASAFRKGMQAGGGAGVGELGGLLTRVGIAVATGGASEAVRAAGGGGAIDAGTEAVARQFINAVGKAVAFVNWALKKLLGKLVNKEFADFIVDKLIPALVGFATGGARATILVLKGLIKFVEKLVARDVKGAVFALADAANEAILGTLILPVATLAGMPRAKIDRFLRRAVRKNRLMLFQLISMVFAVVGGQVQVIVTNVIAVLRPVVSAFLAELVPSGASRLVEGAVEVIFTAAIMAVNGVVPGIDQMADMVVARMESAGADAKRRIAKILEDALDALTHFNLGKLSAQITALVHLPKFDKVKIGKRHPEWAQSAALLAKGSQANVERFGVDLVKALRPKKPRVDLIVKMLRVADIQARERVVEEILPDVLRESNRMAQKRIHGLVTATEGGAKPAHGKPGREKPRGKPARGKPARGAKPRATPDAAPAPAPAARWLPIAAVVALGIGLKVLVGGA